MSHITNELNSSYSMQTRSRHSINGPNVARWRQCKTHTNNANNKNVTEDEICLPRERRFGNPDNRRLEDAPVRFLWTWESWDFSLQRKQTRYSEWVEKEQRYLNASQLQHMTLGSTGLLFSCQFPERRCHSQQKVPNVVIAICLITPGWGGGDRPLQYIWMCQLTVLKMCVCVVWFGR